jgi:hypothetical protein
MKNERKVAYHYQSARMYERHYKANYNPLYLLKSLLFILIAGGSPTATHLKRMK